MLYAAFALLLYVFQHRLVFFPTTGEYPVTPDFIDLSWRDVSLTTDDGIRIAGWFVDGPTDDAPVVLFFHGNAGDMSHRLGTLSALHDLGAATLMIDYRGYGRSGGRPDEDGLYQDARAAWQWLTDEAGYAPDRIVLFGRSLGGPVAAWLAARHEPAGLVLESAFTSMPDLAAHHYPWLPARWLARYDFDTEAAIAGSACPLLIAHSPDDEIVPFRHADALAAVRPDTTRRVRLSGSHNDPSLEVDAAWRSALGDFIQHHAARP
ncbi:MAG: alpha/beta hydrolase [Halofilum sp. (in: g-proteobacteria)]|nr:alpha/beta hydrolase [Halofilum sp. (in: g-proteobacteria)]